MHKAAPSKGTRGRSSTKGLW